MQTPQNQHAGDHLRDHRRNADTCHAHIKLDDKQQIQYRIGTTGNQQKHQRSFRISHRTQNRRTIVIQHKKRHSAEINPHI